MICNISVLAGILAVILPITSGYHLPNSNHDDGIDGQGEGIPNARSLVQRDPPAGWSLHVADGNDGGGCYDDSPTARILDGYGALDMGNRLDICLSICQGKGFKYAGVQFGTECYCDNEVPESLHSAASADCNTPCPSNSAEICGATWKMNLYRYDGDLDPDFGGYRLQGCVGDDERRALRSHAEAWGAMTVESCLDMCSREGYSMAGIEAGRECYCADTFSDGLSWPIDASKCDQRCSGDGAFNCGGDFALSLYIQSDPATPALPAGWRYNECRKDDVNRRLLTYQSKDDRMSAPLCLARCASYGSKYAGVEFGTECYCGNVLDTSSNTLEEGACDMSCGDGRRSGCGGELAISIYEFTGNSDAPQTGDDAPTGSDAEASTPSEGWNYVHCGTDSSSRALTEAFIQDDSMSVNACTSHCAEQGFTFAGLEAGRECHCGNSLQNGQGVMLPDIECSSPCGRTGTSGKCGGLWKISIFANLTGNQLSADLHASASAVLSSLTDNQTALPTSASLPASASPLASGSGSETLTDTSTSASPPASGSGSETLTDTSTSASPPASGSGSATLAVTSPSLGSTQEYSPSASTESMTDGAVVTPTAVSTVSTEGQSAISGAESSSPTSSGQVTSQ